MDLRIMTLTDLPDGLDRLREEARAEGFRFLDRLALKWQEGSNRFDGPGECLLGLYGGAGLVAIGGLNIDPHSQNARIGRLRHVYVRPAARRMGAGRMLVQALLSHGHGRFDQVRLSTDTEAAAQFYARLGFAPVASQTATHLWQTGPHQA